MVSSYAPPLNRDSLTEGTGKEKGEAAGFRRFPEFHSHKLFQSHGKSNALPWHTRCS
jgi:hypothetical protein